METRDKVDQFVLPTHQSATTYRNCAAPVLSRRTNAMIVTQASLTVASAMDGSNCRVNKLPTLMYTTPQYSSSKLHTSHRCACQIPTLIRAKSRRNEKSRLSLCLLLLIRHQSHSCSNLFEEVFRVLPLSRCASRFSHRSLRSRLTAKPLWHALRSLAHLIH